MKPFLSTIRPTLFAAVPALILSVMPMAAHADWSYNAGGLGTTTPQDVVISLKANPMAEPEAACLAVTMARATLYTGFAFGVSVNVTLFPTLDGVALGHRRVVARPRFKCEIPESFPDQETTISLKDNLERFLVAGGYFGVPYDPNTDLDHNHLVICPLCWTSRYGAVELPSDDNAPDYGVLPGVDVPAGAVGMLLLNADKFIDMN